MSIPTLISSQFSHPVSKRTQLWRYARDNLIDRLIDSWMIHCIEQFNRQELHRVSKKLCIFVSVRTSSNFHEF